MRTTFALPLDGAPEPLQRVLARRAVGRLRERRARAAAAFKGGRGRRAVAAQRSTVEALLSASTRSMARGCERRTGGRLASVVGPHGTIAPQDWSAQGRAKSGSNLDGGVASRSVA